MATFKDLVDRVALDYLNRFDLIPEVKRAIRASIKSYEAARWWFNETSTTTTMTANSSSFGVPSDFMALDRIEVAYSGVQQRLLTADFATIRQMNAVTATYVPTHFAYYGDRFELALVPDSAYSTTVYYLQTLPELSADTDSNAWTNEAQNLIAHCATIEMLSTKIDGDERKIAHHEKLLLQALNELHLRNNLRLNNKLRATKF